MRVLVLLKIVPDTWGDRTLNLRNGWLDRTTGDWVVDEISERALEAALALKDGSSDVTVSVVSMGPDSSVAGLRRGLSMGADDAIHVLDDSLPGADAAATARVLAAVARQRGFDLVIAGNESTDGRGGVVPPMIAEHLAVPALSYLDSVEVVGGVVRGERTLDNGTASVHAALPAVISITERCPDARFPSFRGIMAAKRKKLSVLTLAELGVDPASFTTRSTIFSVSERPSRQAGRKVVDDGTAGTQLADFLVAERLV